MKKVILSMVIVLMTVVSACSQSKNSKMTDVTFGVRGNYEIYKTTIEKAANSLKGVVKTVWDKENRNIVVSYNKNKITSMEICKAITKSICDTDISKGNNKVKPTIIYRMLSI